MANVALSTPSVTVNNTPIGIVPNSCEYEPGYGSITVRSASNGGGSATSVHTENAEDKIGMMKFSVYVTVENRQFVKAWKQLIGALRLSAIQVNGEPINLNGASLTNNPNFKASADGVVELEFRGDPMTTV